MSLFPRSDSDAIQDALDSLVRTRRVHLSSAQIKSLKATPAVLVPPPAPRLWVYLTEIVATFRAGASALATVSDLTLDTDGAGPSWATLFASGFLDQTTNAPYGLTLVANGVIGTSAALGGEAILLKNGGAGEFTGNPENDAALTLDVYYRLYPV